MKDDSKISLYRFSYTLNFIAKRAILMDETAKILTLSLPFVLITKVRNRLNHDSKSNPVQ